MFQETDSRLIISVVNVDCFDKDHQILYLCLWSLWLSHFESLLVLPIGVGATKKRMLDDRRFPKMHLNLQRLLQVIAHGDQVFPRVKDKGVGKAWCTSEDLAALEALVGRLRKLKENVGFIANRITAIQAGLDSWQAEQINRKLYYLSFLSIIFLPLSIVTGGKASIHISLAPSLSSNSLLIWFWGTGSE